MPRFFVEETAIREGKVCLTGENAQHISRALRMRAGEEITVCDGHGREYRCRLTGFSAAGVEAEVLSFATGESEPPYDVTLYMALPKGEKMEWILQKGVELGLRRLVPVAASRCVVRLTAADGEKKRQRWQKIAAAAAGQCGRGRLPEVEAPIDFREAVRRASSEVQRGALALFCYEEEKAAENRLPALLRARKAAGGIPSEVSIFVGAEGGFSPEEAALARAAGIPTVGLGRRILRCETAPLFVLSCLSFEWELDRPDARPSE